MAKGHRRHLKAVAAYIERLEREGNHSKVESIRKAKCIRQLSKCIDDPTILEKLESERLQINQQALQRSWRHLRQSSINQPVSTNQPVPPVPTIDTVNLFEPVAVDHIATGLHIENILREPIAPTPSNMFRTPGSNSNTVKRRKLGGNTSDQPTIFDFTNGTGGFDFTNGTNNQNYHYVAASASEQEPSTPSDIYSMTRNNAQVQPSTPSNKYGMPPVE